MSTMMIEASKAQDRTWAAVEKQMDLIGITESEIERNGRYLMAERKISVIKLWRESEAVYKAWLEADDAAVAAFGDPKVSQQPTRRDMVRDWLNGPFLTVVHRIHAEKVR